MFNSLTFHLAIPRISMTAIARGCRKLDLQPCRICSLSIQNPPTIAPVTASFEVSVPDADICIRTRLQKSG